MAKLDANGVVQWAKAWNSTGLGSFTSVAVDTGGNVFVGGSTSTTALDYRSFSVQKYSSTGSRLWAHEWFNNGSVEGVAVNAVGEVVAVGFFEGILDFNPHNKQTSNLSSPGTSGFLLKLSGAGAFGWAKPLTASADANLRLRDVEFLSDGSILTSGFFRGDVDLDPGAAVFAPVEENGGLS